MSNEETLELFKKTMPDNSNDNDNRVEINILEPTPDMFMNQEMSPVESDVDLASLADAMLNFNLEYNTEESLNNLTDSLNETSAKLDSIEKSMAISETYEKEDDEFSLAKELMDELSDASCDNNVENENESAQHINIYNLPESNVETLDVDTIASEVENALVDSEINVITSEVKNSLVDSMNFVDSDGSDSETIDIENTLDTPCEPILDTKLEIESPVNEEPIIDSFSDVVSEISNRTFSDVVSDEVHGPDNLDSLVDSVSSDAMVDEVHDPHNSLDLDISEELSLENLTENAVEAAVMEDSATVEAISEDITLENLTENAVEAAVMEDSATVEAISEDITLAEMDSSTPVEVTSDIGSLTDTEMISSDELTLEDPSDITDSLVDSASSDAMVDEVHGPHNSLDLDISVESTMETPLDLNISDAISEELSLENLTENTVDIAVMKDSATIEAISEDITLAEMDSSTTVEDMPVNSETADEIPENIQETNLMNKIDDGNVKTTSSIDNSDLLTSTVTDSIDPPIKYMVNLENEDSEIISLLNTDKNEAYPTISFVTVPRMAPFTCVILTNEIVKLMHLESESENMAAILCEETLLYFEKDSLMKLNLSTGEKIDTNSDLSIISAMKNTMNIYANDNRALCENSLVYNWFLSKYLSILPDNTVANIYDNIGEINEALNNIGIEWILCHYNDTLLISNRRGQIRPFSELLELICSKISNQ